jgi:hypothetical protein
MLLITVAATAFPCSRPAAFICRLHIRSTASPSTIAPLASTKIARSPSPSNATPRRAPAARTARASDCGCVDPQSRLMFRPSGDAPTSCTSKPSSENSLGATVVMAPLAVSSTIRIRPRRWGSGSESRACARYASATSSAATWASAEGGTAHPWAATMASTSRSSSGVNFSPRPENTLIPLSWKGLCEAEMTMPASKSISRVTYAMAGVGMTPALVTVAPADPAPLASSRSIHSPDSRVSRPTIIWSGASATRIARTSAAPRRATVCRSSGYSPARPRTPSVPKSCGIAVGPCCAKDVAGAAYLIVTSTTLGVIELSPKLSAGSIWTRRL